MRKWFFALMTYPGQSKEKSSASGAAQQASNRTFSYVRERRRKSCGIRGCTACSRGRGRKSVSRQRLGRKVEENGERLGGKLLVRVTRDGSF